MSVFHPKPSLSHYVMSVFHPKPSLCIKVLPRTHPKPPKTHQNLPILTQTHQKTGRGVKEKGENPRRSHPSSEKATQEREKHSKHTHSIERKAQKGQKVQKAEGGKKVTSSWPWRPFESTCELREQPMCRKKRKRNVSKRFCK
jgi:hypothetical protein